MYISNYLHLILVGITNDNSLIEPTRFKTVIAIMKTFKLDLKFLNLANTINREVLKKRLNIRSTTQ